MTPAPFGVYHPATGKDCTSIPHVDDVACQSASCYVISCKHDFVPSATHDSCVPISSASAPSTASPSVDKRMFNLGPGIEAVTPQTKHSANVVKRAGVVTGATADIRNMVKLGEGAGLAVVKHL